MLTIELYQLKQENNPQGFYNKISTFIPDLKKFARTKLKIAENLGLIDKGFYNVSDVLDEVYMEVFKIMSKNTNEKTLRKILFIKTTQNINKKTKIAAQFSNHINVNDILKEELELLNEDYTIDADGDFVLIKELDDISYHQKDFKQTHFILDDTTQQEINKKLSLDDTFSLSTGIKRRLFEKTFFDLPVLSKSIIEMHVFGNQSISEIGEILSLDQENIKTVIDKVTERFRLLH